MHVWDVGQLASHPDDIMDAFEVSQRDPGRAWVMGHEQVAGEGWHEHAVGHGPEDAIAALDGDHGQPCVVAGALQICLRPLFGLRVGVEAEPSALHASAVRCVMLSQRPAA